MLIKFVKSGEKKSCGDSYASRLIEQGHAVRCDPEPEPFMNPPEPEAEALPEDHKKTKTGKTRKG